MKISFILGSILLIQTWAFAGQRSFCHFEKGVVYNSESGQQVSKHFKPKIFANIMRLDSDKSEKDIFITSPQNASLNLFGSICHASQPPVEGYDCFTLHSNDLKRSVQAYSSNTETKYLILATSSGVAGKFTMNDIYNCN